MKIFLLILGWIVTLWSIFGVANLIGIKSYYFYGQTDPWYAVPYFITSFFIMLIFTVIVMIELYEELS